MRPKAKAFCIEALTNLGMCAKNLCLEAIGVQIQLVKELQLQTTRWADNFKRKSFMFGRHFHVKKSHKETRNCFKRTNYPFLCSITWKIRENEIWEVRVNFEANNWRKIEVIKLALCLTLIWRKFLYEVASVSFALKTIIRWYHGIFMTPIQWQAKYFTFFFFNLHSSLFKIWRNFEGRFYLLALFIVIEAPLWLNNGV